MATVNAPLISFNGGELGALMGARVDQNSYPNACKRMENFLPHAQGPMSRRPPLMFVDDFADHTLRGWMFPFEYSIAENYLILAHQNVFKFYLNDALTTVPSVSTTINNGTFASSLTGWTGVSSGSGSTVTQGSGVAIFTRTGAGEAAITQSVTVALADRTVQHYLKFEVLNGPINLKIGTASNTKDILDVSGLERGTHQISFTPGSTSPIWITFAADKDGEKYLDNVSFMGAGTFTLAHPYDEEDLPDVHYGQKGDILWLTHGSYVTKKLERRGVNSWSLVDYEPADGPYEALTEKSVSLTPSGVTGKITVQASGPVFTADDVRTIFRLTSSGQTVTMTGDSLADTSDSIRVSGLDNSRRFTFFVSGDLRGRIDLEASIGNEDNYTVITSRTYNGVSEESFQYGNLNSHNNLIVYWRAKIGAYTSGTANVTLSYQGGSGEGAFRILSVTDSDTAIAEVTKPLGSTAATFVWQRGEWSALRGYPSTVTFFGPRLWFGRGIYLWGSASDDFDNFAPSIEDDGAISRSIAGATDGIQFLSGALNLIIGSASQELVGRASSFDEPITPKSFQTSAPSQEGGAHIMPVVAVGAVLYVQRAQRTLHEFSFNTQLGQAGQYVSVDLTRLNPEALQDGILRLALQREPERRVFVLLRSGKCKVATYRREEQITGWATVTTSGHVEDVLVIQSNGEDRVYFIIRREIGGAQLRYIERFGTEVKLNDEELYFSDSSLSLPLERPEATAFPANTTGMFDVRTDIDTFLSGDVGKVIWINGGRANIVSRADAKHVTVETIFDLHSTDAAPPFQWGIGEEIVTVSGLEHLIGRSVGIVADGAILPLQVVDALGKVTLPYPASAVHVGLPFSSYYESLRLAYGHRAGTALTMQKQVGPLGILYLRTGSGVRYGTSATNLAPLIMPDPDLLYGEAPHLESGEQVVPFPGGYESDPRLYIEVSDASPCTIQGLVPTISEVDRP